MAPIYHGVARVRGLIPSTEGDRFVRRTIGGHSINQVEAPAESSRSGLRASKMPAPANRRSGSDGRRRAEVDEKIAKEQIEQNVEGAHQPVEGAASGRPLGQQRPSQARRFSVERYLQIRNDKRLIIESPTAPTVICAKTNPINKRSRIE